MKVSDEQGYPPGCTRCAERKADVERLRKQVEHWKAQAADVARCHIDAIARAERAEAALRIIAGYEQCVDNLMSNVEAARAALREEEKP